MAKIRGLAFLGTARHVKTAFGDEMLGRIVRDAGPETRQTFSQRINGLALHPYAAFCGLLRSVDRHLGSGDLTYCRVLGDLAAHHDLSTIFKGYAQRLDPEDMIRACTPIWAMYTDGAGTMAAVSIEPAHTVLCIQGFPEMDPAHCQMMCGWMTAAMDFINVELIHPVVETQCASRGGAQHEFTCQWKPRD